MRKSLSDPLQRGLSSEIQSFRGLPGQQPLLTAGKLKAALHPSRRWWGFGENLLDFRLALLNFLRTACLSEALPTNLSSFTPSFKRSDQCCDHILFPLLEAPWPVSLTGLSQVWPELATATLRSQGIGRRVHARQSSKSSWEPWKNSVAKYF